MPGDTRVEQRRRAFREHGASIFDDLIFRLRARRVLAQFPQSCDVTADLGSGHDFRLLRHLVDTGRTSKGIAVDISLNDEFRQRTPTVRLLESDLGDPLPIADATVDVVLSLAVLEHMARPDIHLAEAHRILRSPGLLLLTSPSPSSRRLLEFLAYRLHMIDEHEIRDHKDYYGERALLPLLTQAGFARDAISYRTFLLGLNQFVVARKT